MMRFTGQSDLFAQPEAPVRRKVCDPVAELTALLDTVRAADRLPWPNLAEVMAEEHRALGLARLAGAEGEALATAFLIDAERLFALTD